MTPTRRYDRTRISVDPDSFDRTAIKQIVHAFYERREIPTLIAVWWEAKEKGVFSAGRFCLWREMGFLYKKRDTKRYIYEQKKTLLNNDILIYTKYENADTRTDQ